MGRYSCLAGIFSVQLSAVRFVYEGVGTRIQYLFRYAVESYPQCWPAVFFRSAIVPLRHRRSKVVSKLLETVQSPQIKVFINYVRISKPIRF